MFKKISVAVVLSAVTLAAIAGPAHAGGWSYTGPRGHSATFNHWGGGGYYGHGYYGHGPCCYRGGAVAAAGVAGLAVGAAVGVAAASHPAYPVYVAPPPVVYAAPPPVVYAAPPPAYYYTP
jgi:hypothetical protein